MLNHFITSQNPNTNSLSPIDAPANSNVFNSKNPNGTCNITNMADINPHTDINRGIYLVLYKK